MNDHRDLDIVLVGATGFVGRLTAAHLAENAEGRRVGLAGRDRERLDAARAALPEAARDWELIVVDVTDPAQAAELAGRARVVCTTVGPYEEYGSALVRACAEAGTHYCDLAGELTFVRRSIDELDAVARRTGARIVHSCGFDSIPSDLGVLETASAAAAAGDGELTDTVTHVRSLKGGLSGGTFASMRGQIVRAGCDPQVRRLTSAPDALAPDPTASGRRRQDDPARHRGVAGVLRRAGVRRDPTSGRWSAPFFMASYNTRVVRASNVRSGHSYGRDFRYSEVVDTGSGLQGAAGSVSTAAFVGGLFGGMAFAPTRAVLDRVLPAPGEGPSEESMAQGHYTFVIEAATTSGARWQTRFADDRDPGYTSTAVMLGQSALALTGEGGSPGVHTPATGLGRALVARLRTQGFEIETSRSAAGGPGRH